MKEFTFDTLDGEGRLIESHTIYMSDIKRCPKVILLPSHYREDGSCRCNETLCEADDCAYVKFGEEIYCEYHLQEYYGLSAEDLIDE